MVRTVPPAHPALEAAARAREGKVVLAKLDTDANQHLAATYGIQGIPAVKAFRDGSVVEEFVGAQPPAAVERFFDGLVPSEADARRRGRRGLPAPTVSSTPARADARVALARLLRDQGSDDEALELLENAAGTSPLKGSPPDPARARRRSGPRRRVRCAGRG